MITFAILYGKALFRNLVNCGPCRENPAPFCCAHPTSLNTKELRRLARVLQIMGKSQGNKKNGQMVKKYCSPETLNDKGNSNAATALPPL